MSRAVDRASRRRAEAGRFLRFCCVGGVGFGVDAAILTAFVHLGGAPPIPARLLSAAAAMMTTFELNRRWAFRAGAARYGAALAAYLGVQSLGFACNFGIYAGCCLLLPAPLYAPFVGLVAGSGAALAFNYAGASRVVFRAAAP